MKKIFTLFAIMMMAFTTSFAENAPAVTSVVVSDDKTYLTVHFDADDATPNGSFVLETAAGVVVNSVVEGDWGADFGDVIYFFSQILEANDYVLVIPGWTMEFELNGDVVYNQSDIRIPFTVGGGASKVDLTALSQKIAEASAKENPSEALMEAIAAAGDVLDKEGVTQAEVDAAVKALDEAIGVFNGINTVSVSAAKVAKAMVNGKVVIVKGAKQYNVAGQEL